MAYEEKYIKLLEERVEELQQQLAVEQKKKTPSLSDNELLMNFMAAQIQVISNGNVPIAYRCDAAKGALKARKACELSKAIIDGKFTVEPQYLNMIKEAMENRS